MSLNIQLKVNPMEQLDCHVWLSVLTDLLVFKIILGVVQCTCLKMAYSLKTAGHREKLVDSQFPAAWEGIPLFSIKTWALYMSLSQLHVCKSLNSIYEFVSAQY